MIQKKPLRLRWWVVESNMAGRLDVKYFFTEPDARTWLDRLNAQLPITLDLYPDESVERYYGYFEAKDYAVEIRTLNAQDAVRRYRRIVAHMICHSLGYCTPYLAAALVLIAAKNGTHFCEWISTIYQRDPWPALCAAIAERNSHRGYMRDFDHALSIVDAVRGGSPEPVLASWF